MTGNIKAHPTFYEGVQFRSRLEARWAVFFDGIGWEWEYEPLDLFGWTPDFRVTFGCTNEPFCNPVMTPYANRIDHSLLIEVKPYYTIKEFNGHPCTNYPFGVMFDSNDQTVRIPADSSAAFGINPTVTGFYLFHGSRSLVQECSLRTKGIGKHLDVLPHTNGIATSFSDLAWNCARFRNEGATEYLDEAMMLDWKDAGNVVQWWANHK